jgi:hypothetical protein
VSAVVRHSGVAPAAPLPTRMAFVPPRIRLPSVSLALELLAQFHAPLLAFRTVALACRCLPGDHQGKHTDQETESETAQRVTSRAADSSRRCPARAPSVT